MTDEKKCLKCTHEHTKEDGTCTCGCEESKKQEGVKEEVKEEATKQE